MMDASKIRINLTVNARNPGVDQGPCVVKIGTVEWVEANGYIKLAKDDAPDGFEHWFPIDWVETVDEEIVYLNQSADKVMAGLINELPC